MYVITESTQNDEQVHDASPDLRGAARGATGAESIRLEALVHHREAVEADLPLEQVQTIFREKKVKFLAVLRNRCVIGVCAREQLTLIMSARFGFAIHSQDPVESVMLERPVYFTDGTPLREMLDRAFSRQNDDFHEDVVLVDHDQHLLGLIKVETLAQLQSRLVADQVDELELQQETLRIQNLELFRANHAARQSQGLFTGLFENHSLGVALLDTQGVIHQHNRRLAELLNRGDATLADLPLASIVAAVDRPVFRALLAAQEQAEKGVSIRELTLEVPGRGARQFRCSTGWVREIGHVCACLEDVTEQRALERSALRQEKQMLLDTIVGGIAHELNNKLMPVIGYAELLSMDGGGDRREYLDIITKSVAESARIVRQLQDLSRPEMPDTQILDLRTIVEETLAMLKFGLREAKCLLRNLLPSTPVFVSADAGQLKQVVLNLVINALHAMEGCPQPLLTVGVRLEDGVAHLLVGDNGCGIPAANLGRIFDPFFTTKEPARGTGLGLSICASIVRQHGGEIAVESRDRTGTQFTVTLPLATEQTARSLPEGDLGLVAALAQTGDARVLVVDDEEVLRRLMQEMLRAKFGCQVDLAPGGMEALRLLEHKDYALVISDIRMPEMNGAEFFQNLRELRPDYADRFVFVTGYPGDNHLSEEIGRCDVPVVAKPFTVDRFAEVCRPYLIGGTRRLACA